METILPTIKMEKIVVGKIYKRQKPCFSIKKREDEKAY